MSNVVQKYWFFNNIVLKTKIRNKRRAVIKSADKYQIKALAEIVANTLGGSIPVSPGGRKQLRPFKTVLRKISHKSTSNKDRKHLIFQNLVSVIKLLNLVKPALELLK